MSPPAFMIDGVLIHPLRQVADERGKVMHMLKSTDPWFRQFGEVYFSSVNPGAVKAWKLHTRMALNLAVVHGAARLVIFDDRDPSATRGQVQEFVLSPDNYQLVTVPPGVWTGFAGVSSFPALVANCASLPHDPAEVLRKAPNDPAIPYAWNPVAGAASFP